MWLPLGATGLLGSRFRNLLDRPIDLRGIILVNLGSRRLMLLRLDERRRGRNWSWRRLGKRRGRLREIGNRSSAEVREVRNGLETIRDGSQIG